jgi:predicted nuclease with TOPRIM domain
MTVKLILIMLTLGLMLGFVGCATKGWTEDQLKLANAKANNDFQTQNGKLLKNVDDLNKENAKLYKLLRSLSRENSSLHKNLSILNDKLIKLENLIVVTENKTLREIKSFSKQNDRKLYKYITAQQQKYIDDLRKEMEKVSQADDNAKKLREVIQKILKAYDTAKDKK